MSTSKLSTYYSARETLELMSFLAYDFKTQFNSIAACISLLVDELNLSAEDPRSKLLTDITSAARDIQIQLGKLVRLAKSETPGFQLEMEAVDVDSIVCESTERLLPDIRCKNQTIEINRCQELPTIRADRLRIEQILVNLLSNASQNTPNGGHLSISTGQQDNFVVIQIEDSAPAIPVEEQRYLFQPFYQPPLCNKEYAGANLNLALCKHFVELHGGKIQIENKGIKGNVFSIFLPFEQ